MIRLDYNINWSEHFQLSEDSPSGLVRVRNYQGVLIEKINIGNRLYNKNGSPHCWRFEFKGKKYCVHRVIWVLNYGSIDSEKVVDHLDGDPFNNNIQNLELKTQKDNTRNKQKRFNSMTGITGVSYSFNRVGNRCYVAYWSELDGVRRSRSFSVVKFGEETAKILAIKYREQEIQRLISEGADYTERHGN